MKTSWISKQVLTFLLEISIIYLYGVPGRGSQRKGRMTSTELGRMSPEQKERLYYDTPMKSTAPINSETDDIKTVIDNYTKSKMPLDDVPTLIKELSEITA